MALNIRNGCKSCVALGTWVGYIDFLEPLCGVQGKTDNKNVFFRNCNVTHNSSNTYTCWKRVCYYKKYILYMYVYLCFQRFLVIQILVFMMPRVSQKPIKYTDIFLALPK